MKIAHDLHSLRKVLLIWVAALSCTMVLTGCSLLSRSYTMSGVVTDALYGKGVGGVTISFSGLLSDPVITAADGTWTKGAVTVTPSKTGMVFSPSSTVVSKASSHVDFVGSKAIESV